MEVSHDLADALRRYWGYDQFRPRQEPIIREILAGRDVAVVMPTGGGKSLCYQLPAVVTGHTTVVISPLIALMQDQVESLGQMGISAGVVNSTLSSGEQTATIRRAIAGEFRLLYLSPERLARRDTIAWLQQVPIGLFAIDEAHCISEWGHEFRPEYRQLSSLRTHFPDVPIGAFTASATQRVRHDILHQLQLHEPARFIVSFHRPNLRYLVRQCDMATQPDLLLAALRAHAGANVIVYAPTIQRVGETVDLLQASGIEAVPYHGQMEADERRRSQERWMSDEVRVLVGTIAFGLGINKPSVRAVIHLSLPKSIEQYYQEAGRAGRDGQPADCLMLWQKRDAGLLAFFIDQLKDAEERERAWERYHAIRQFAEAGACRHRDVCLHFGEKPKWERCEVCDACGNLPDWLREAEGVARAPRTRRATERPVPKNGRAVGEADPDLMEWLREWRRAVAGQQGVSAFLVATDATLQDLCRRRPATMDDLLQVEGVGHRKAEQYGEQLLAALRQYRQGSRAATRRRSLETPADETLRLLLEGHSLEEITHLRQRTYSTVVTTVADLVEQGRVPFNPAWVPTDRQERIEQEALRVGMSTGLRPIKDMLPEDFTYPEIRLVVARLKAATPGSMQ